MALHKAFIARTGYQIRYNTHRERQWYDWCKWSDWEWTERELAIVIHYLRAKIAKSERNDGALKLENLIGNPDRFEEDLNLALEARKGTPTFRQKPTSKAAPQREGLVNSFGEPVESGEQAVANFLQLLKERP